MTETKDGMESHKRIRDILHRYGQDGDIYMRMRGFYWTGPRKGTDPEFGYRDLTGRGDRAPLWKESADLVQNLVEYIESFDEINAEKKRLAHDIMVEIDGPDAAPAPSLCDVLGAVKDLMSDYRMATTPSPTTGPEDLIEEALTAHWGERCPDKFQGCGACDAWSQLDDLRRRAEANG